MGNFTLYSMFCSLLAIQCFLTTEAAVFRRETDGSDSSDGGIFDTEFLDVFFNKDKFCDKFDAMLRTTNINDLLEPGEVPSESDEGLFQVVQSARPICDDPNATSDDLIKLFGALEDSDERKK